MRILITGAKGFVGKNLVAALKNLQEGKDRTRPELKIDEIFAYDLDSSGDLLHEACQKADFVFHLAGVNRPKDPAAFMQGNLGFTEQLLEELKAAGNNCPVMISSSIQASLLGRFSDSEYGRSKLAGEEALFAYGRETGAKVLVYRFPNLFGKWCRPDYNSVVATFCHHMANSLPITVSDPSARLELVYIDDLVDELLLALENKPHRCNYDGLNPLPDPEGNYCYVPISHQVTLQEIVSHLETFVSQPETLLMPEIPAGSFEKKLYSTYLSYLPKEKISFALKMNKDARGSFTELMKTASCGQFSVNISLPGITKGEHWHHSKWEYFMVVSGHGLIRMRNMDSDEVLEFEVSGEEMRAVCMLPGYTHSLINLSESENLVTLMWANEPFDPQKPDTFFLPV